MIMSTVTSWLLENSGRLSGLCRLGRVDVYTVVFLALLGAAAAQQPSNDRGANDSGPLSWGAKEHGVRTALSAGEEEFALGKPMLFRLVIENLGRRAVKVDPIQVAINSSMAIETGDGVSVPYIKGWIQTGIGQLVLKPGERAVLFEALDIADQYLLTSPGTYNVQFKHQYSGDPDTASIDIPASNVLTITMTDGAVKPSRLVARKLLDAMQPSGWSLRWVKEGDVVPIGRSSVNGTIVVFSRGRVMTKDDLPVRLWVTASPSGTTPPKQDEKRESPAEPIGRCPWGDVYLSASTEEFSTVRKLATAALQIEEP